MFHPTLRHRLFYPHLSGPDGKITSTIEPGFARKEPAM
jgi:hypothetical protein